MSVVHMYHSRDKSITGPCGIALCAADYSQMDTVCLFQSGAVRKAKSDWMAHVYAADALTDTSIICVPCPWAT